MRFPRATRRLQPFVAVIQLIAIAMPVKGSLRPKPVIRRGLAQCPLTDQKADIRANCCGAERSLYRLRQLWDLEGEETGRFRFRRLMTHNRNFVAPRFPHQAPRGLREPGRGSWHIPVVESLIRLTLARQSRGEALHEPDGRHQVLERRWMDHKRRDRSPAYCPHRVPLGWVRSLESGLACHPT